MKLKYFIILILIIANENIGLAEMRTEKENTTLCNEAIDCNDPNCFKLENKLNEKICFDCVCE